LSKRGHRCDLLQALNVSEPFAAASAFARELRDRGMSQREVLELFDATRTELASDADERRYNAILDVMDLIAGWCHPMNAIFER
jgi:hypothetical protein